MCIRDRIRGGARTHGFPEPAHQSIPGGLVKIDHHIPAENHIKFNAEMDGVHQKMCIRDRCTYLNSTAKKLENLQGTYETYLDQDIQKVNDILKNIQDLNTSIRDADIRGDDALELRDSRNMLLDELSQYMDIDVKYTMENVGAGFMVEKLTVTLATGDQNRCV